MCTEKVPFVDVNELEVHLATQHFHVSPYGCALCGMESKWATEYALKGHYARAHGINDVKVCDMMDLVEMAYFALGEAHFALGEAHLALAQAHLALGEAHFALDEAHLGPW
jgi:hypothetical protein